MTVLCLMSIVGVVADAGPRETASLRPSRQASEVKRIVESAAEQPPDGNATTPVRIDGSLKEYDSRAQVISLTTPAGEMTLTITATTRLRDGRHRFEKTRLAHFIGARVIARYAESATSRVLLSLRVLDDSSRRDGEQRRP